MHNINNGGPAFPVNDHGASNLVGSAAIEGITDPAERDRVYIAAVAKALSGMTLREYFAVHASESEIVLLMPKTTGDMRDELIRRGIIPPENKQGDVLNSYARTDVQKLRVALRYEFADLMISARGAE